MCTVVCNVPRGTRQMILRCIEHISMSCRIATARRLCELLSSRLSPPEYRPSYFALLLIIGHIPFKLTMTGGSGQMLTLYPEILATS